MRIVIFAPAGGYDSGSLAGMADADEVTVIAWSGASSADARLISLADPQTIGSKIDRAAQRTMPGRMLLRLTPRDPGVRFWNATRTSDDARAAIRDADVLIASERDGAYAAWKWARSAARAGHTLPSVFGYPAGRAAIERIAR